MAEREMLREKRIAVLAGGVSAEREVSLSSGRAVHDALFRTGYDAHFIDVKQDVYERLREYAPEIAFIVLHGGWGENGGIQGMLEIMGIPYTGSGVLASAMAMDKVVTKKIFQMSGVNVPRYMVAGSEETGLIDRIVSFGPPPWVVKPVAEGSSVGVSIVDGADGLDSALQQAFRFGSNVVIEEYIRGKEVQIGILGREILGGVEVRPKKRFYDYEAKYTKGMTDYILPPEIDGALYREAGETALKAHLALGCAGATRVDLIIDDEARIYALEVNTIPGMTETSLLPKIAALAGYGFTELLEKILIDALERHEG